MATGANRVPLGRLNPAMSKRKSGGSDGAAPSLLSQHRQQPQTYRNEQQPPLPQNPPPTQHMPHQPYYQQGNQQYMHQPPLPTMQMQQPPLPPQSNMYNMPPQPPPPQAQPPPPPPPQQPSTKPPMPMANDESHQQMLDYMQRIPQQRSEKVKDSPGDQPAKKRKKKSRWGDTEEKTRIPGMPVALPSHLTADQQKQYLLHFQIEEISIKLRSGNLGIPEDPDDRSPSPEPIYNSEGKRLNTREFRVRKNLEEERHALIQEAYELNQEYKPPPDYKPPSTKIQDKVMIPQDKNPTINFIGLLIGPRGNTLKKMEKETGCKIIIRGKGSVKEGKVGRPGGPLPGEDEPLHALVTGPSHLDVKKALDVIRKIIKEGIECPESANELRRMQLRELAALNGTLIEEDMVRCRNCGGTDHRHWECTEQKNVTNMVVCTKCGGYGHVENDCVYQVETGEVTQTFEDKVKMDEEYMSLMAELQGGDPNAAASAAKNAQTMAMKPNDNNKAAGPPPIPVSAPWNAPPNSSNPPPSLLGNPPGPQQPNRLPRPTPRPAPLMSTNAPQPLMSSGPIGMRPSSQPNGPNQMRPSSQPGGPIGMRPSSQPPPWASNNQPRGNAPPPLANFGNRGGPPNQHSGRMPMPNMQMRMQSPPARGMNQPLQPPPPPPPGVSPQQPALPGKPQNAPNTSGSSWDAGTPPRWQMGQQANVGYMMPGMSPYGAAPPPPPPGPSAPAPALPPWATAPPPPPPPPPS